MTKAGENIETLNLPELLQPSEMTREAMRGQACDFWKAQDKVLAGWEEFASGWFGRRHAATQSALAAAGRMCEAGTPADALREYQNWAQGSAERIAADMMAWQRFWMRTMSQTAAQVTHVAEASAGPGFEAKSKAEVVEHRKAA